MASSSSSPWTKTKTTSKSTFDWAWKKLDLLGAPVNRLSNKLGSEAFWPTTIDRESDKAARILRSFCKDGFYSDIDTLEKETVVPESEKVTIHGKQHVVKKIPQRVIRDAVGLCIFTTMRSGLWVSGAGGSGVLVARLPDGSWSPPSGVLLHTAGLGFLVGVDIYDCVVVINTPAALRAFEHPRVTLGGEISAVAGPVGAGGVLESEVHKRRAPVWNYIKSRGFYAGVQVDGTVVIERGDENERFYGERVKAGEILAGRVRRVPPETRVLMETLRAAQGDRDVDAALLPGEGELAPGDYELEATEVRVETGFGVPAPEDPDPFGVRALEDTGLEIHEAGTGKKPGEEEFEFHPSPTSPVFVAGGGHGTSIDEAMGSHRASTLGQLDSEEKRRSLDHATQTEGPMEADIGHDGTGKVREHVEEQAREAREEDEFETPAAEMKVVDPIAEAGEKLEDIDLGQAGEKRPSEELTGGQKVMEKAEILEKGPPPALPPR